jgi:hypothetical protein
MSKPKPVFTATKGKDRVIFNDLTGLEIGLTVQTNPAEAGLLLINCGDNRGMLLERGLARELAGKLLQYAETLHVVKSPRKQEWLLCTRCGKKRWRLRVNWIEDNMRCHGNHCSYCGYSEGVYVSWLKTKGTKKA